MALVAALLCAGCGPDDQHAPVIHYAAGRIYSLSDENGSTLLIATERGLFRLSPGASRPRRVHARVTESALGSGPLGAMTVADGQAHDLLASAHPLDEPTRNLGVVSSLDAGHIWQGAALLGRADFHPIVAARHHAYGFNVLDLHLYASFDDGQSWSRRGRAPIYDIAIDPSDPNHFVASTSDGALESGDGGLTVRPTGLQPRSKLVWIAPHQLLSADPTGTVRRSTDGGGTSKLVGSLPGPPVALGSVGARTLYAALTNRTVVRSRDRGVTWTPVFRFAR